MSRGGLGGERLVAGPSGRNRRAGRRNSRITYGPGEARSRVPRSGGTRTRCGRRAAAARSTAANGPRMTDDIIIIDHGAVLASPPSGTGSGPGRDKRSAQARYGSPWRTAAGSEVSIMPKVWMPTTCGRRVYLKYFDTPGLAAAPAHLGQQRAVLASAAQSLTRRCPASGRGCERRIRA